MKRLPRQCRRSSMRCRRLGGFRLRGIQMTRLETFIDAAFAFAITMMVIAAQQVPDDIATLLGAFANVPAFLAGVIVIGIFWRGHWLWSRRFGLEDGVSILISWAMIATILIYIYPLKAIFGAMWYLLSQGRVGHVLGPHSDSLSTRSLCVLCHRICRNRSEVPAAQLARLAIAGAALGLNARERLMTRAEVTGWGLPVGIGVISFLFALTLPIEQLAWSGWIYSRWLCSCRSSAVGEDVGWKR